MNYRIVIGIMVCIGLGIIGLRISGDRPPDGPPKPLAGVWRGPRFPFGEGSSCVIDEETVGQLELFATNTFEFDIETDVVCSGLYQRGNDGNQPFIDMKTIRRETGQYVVRRYTYHITGTKLVLTTEDGDDFAYHWQARRNPSQFP